MKKMFNCVFSAVRSLVSTSSDRRGGGRAPGVRRLGVESLEVRELLSVSNFQSSSVAMAPETPEFICTTAVSEENILVSCSALIDDQDDLFDNQDEASSWDAFESDSSETGLESLARIRATAPEYGPLTFEQHLAFALLDSDEEPFDSGGDGDARGDGCDNGCDTGCNVGCEDKISFAKLGCDNNLAYACNDGSASQFATELVVIQNEYGRVTIPAMMDGSCDTGHYKAITIQNPGNYWDKSVSEDYDWFTWTKPDNVSNSAAQRDFTFNFIIFADADGDMKYDVGETILDSISLTVHIAYAELTVSIAGEEFKHVSDLNKTVIAGQKIEAKIDHDPRLTVVEDNSRTWSVSSAYPQRVKNYSASSSSGTVENLTASDYHTPVLKYYGLQNDQCSISCTFNVQWTPTGVSTVHSELIIREVDLDVIAPAATITSSFNGEVSIPSPAEANPWVVCPDFTVSSSIAPISRDGVVFDNGQVNFLQTVTEYNEAISPNMHNTSPAYGTCVVDKRFPYGYAYRGESEEIEATIFPSGWNLSNETVNISTLSAPKVPLIVLESGSWNRITVNQQYCMSLIYKPSGTDSIWIPLKRVEWYWGAECNLSSSNDQWQLTSKSKHKSTNDQLPLQIQTWTGNIDNQAFWE